MDFPSQSCTLATCHANKGDVPPAQSHENELCIRHAVIQNHINLNKNYIASKYIEAMFCKIYVEVERFNVTCMPSTTEYVLHSLE